MSRTYAELTQDLKDWTEDDSTEFSNEIDSFIELAENRIFGDVPKLPAFRNTFSGTLTASNNSLTFDSTIREIRYMRITVSGSKVNLQQRTDSYLDDYWPDSTSTGQPKFYALTDETTVLLAPTPDSNYSYQISARSLPTGLSSGNTTTWLSTNAHNMLLYACLMEAYVFKEDEKQLAQVSELYAAEVQKYRPEADRQFNNEYHSGV